MTRQEEGRSTYDRTWGILLSVAVLGFALTFGMARHTAQNAADRLAQRFELVARERATDIVDAFQIPLEQLAAVSRLFESVGGVERERQHRPPLSRPAAAVEQSRIVVHLCRP